jgi:2'-hydroxyisoflavone reductase
MGELLAGGDVTWVSDDFLVEHGVGEWIELPLWIADPEWVGHHDVDVSRAVAAGLAFRPVAETIRDTAEWAATRGDEHEPEAGLAPERERELLQAWRTRS